MRKEKADKKTTKIFETSTVLFLLATLFMSIAFANVTDIKLTVTGSIVAPLQEGVFISDIISASKTGVLSEEVKYYKGTTLSSTVNLSSETTSSMIYDVYLYNNSGDEYYFKGVVYDEAAYDNENIAHSVIGITPYLTTIKAREELTFKLEFKYAEGVTPTVSQTLNSMLNFSFSNEMIEFAILETKYTAPKGITWQQFVESGYNTYKFTIADNKVYTPDGKELINKDKAKNILPTDEITTEDVVYIPLPELTLDKEAIVLEVGNTDTLTVTSTVESMIENLTWEVSPTDSGVTLSGTGATRTISATKAIENVTIKVSYGELITKECTLYVTENYVLELNDSTAGTLSDYKIYGNSVQYGTPSPTNPVEIQSVGDKTKNLFDIGTVDEYFTNKTSLSINGNSLTGAIDNNWAGSYAIKLTNYLSGQYTISMQTSVDRIIILCYDSDGTQLDNTTVTLDTSNFTYNTYYKGWFTTYSTVNVTIPDNVSYWQVGFVFRDPNDEVGTTSTIFNIQIEEGTTATEYEPYGYRIPVKVTDANGESTTTNIYLNEPLRKIGDYADYIDFANKKVVRKIGEKIFNGTEDIRMVTSQGINLFYTFDGGYKTSSYYGFCNYYPNNTAVVDDAFSISDAIYFKDNSFTTVDAFKTWLSERDLILDYILATSTEETISLLGVDIYDGYTRIEVLTEVAPSNMEVQLPAQEISFTITYEEYVEYIDINQEIVHEEVTETYTAIDGMTFAEWVDSEYNTAGWIHVEYGEGDWYTSYYKKGEFGDFGCYKLDGDGAEQLTSGTSIFAWMDLYNS